MRKSAGVELLFIADVDKGSENMKMNETLFTSSDRNIKERPTVTLVQNP